MNARVLPAREPPACCSSVGLLWLLGLFVVALVGCQSIPTPAIWPFVEKERTSYHTPAMRIDAIREYAARSTHTDSQAQRELTDQLARQIQVEADPLARLAIVESIAEFRTPLAEQVLSAGLNDADERVREACCRELGERGDVAAIANLAKVLENDQDLDVRLAAVDALGHLATDDAAQALSAALSSRDPALQYEAVQSLRAITGRDYGGNVATWRQYLAGEDPQPPPAPSVAERVRQYMPF